jgi:hypothetical protein
MRPFPPTLYQQWEGLLCRQQLSRRHEQTIWLLVRTSRHCTSFRQQRLTSRPLSRSIGRLADTNSLVAALVITTYLRRPIRQMRPLPPALNRQWGGLHCQLCPISCRRERTIRLLVRTSCRCKSSRQQRLTSQPLSCSIGRLANTNGLVAALVVATYLGRPIRQMRPLPPTLNRQWGDFTAHSVRSHVGASEQSGSLFASISLPLTLHH